MLFLGNVLIAASIGSDGFWSRIGFGLLVFLIFAVWKGYHADPKDLIDHSTRINNVFKDRSASSETDKNLPAE